MIWATLFNLGISAMAGRRSWLLLLALRFSAVCQWSFTAGPTDSDPKGRLLGRTARRVRERRQVSPRPRLRRTEGDSSYTAPQVVTSRAKNAVSPSEILDIMQSEHDNPELNLISISAAWCRLAQLQHSINAETTTMPSFLMFVRLTRSLLEKPAGLARSVANTLWATARLQGRASTQLAMLWAPLLSAANTTASDMNAQGVANSIWAVVKLVTSDSNCQALLTVLPALAKRVPAVVAEMKAQEVSNVMWAVAKLATTNANSEALLNMLPALASRVPAVVSEMKAQEVSNIIWAITKLARTRGDAEAMMGLLPVLAGRIPEVVARMKAQEVSNLIWATGQLSVVPSHSAMMQDLRKVLPVVVAQAGEVLAAAKPQELANSCLGLALSNYYDAAFFEAVAAKVVNEVAEWKPAGARLDLPEVFFAFAKLEAAGHEGMLGVAAQKLTPLSRISDWGLCVLSWSYQQMDRSGNFLFFRQSLGSEVDRRNLSEADVKRSCLGPEAW